MEESNNNRYWLLHTWDVSPEDAETLEKASIGDTINIEEALIPTVFTDEDEYFLLAFSTEDNIPRKYQEEYARAQDSLSTILIKMKAVQRILGAEPILVIDPFCEKEAEYTLQQLQEIVDGYA